MSAMTVECEQFVYLFTINYIHNVLSYIYIYIYTQTAECTELFRPLWTHQCSTEHETGPGGNEEEQQFRHGQR